MRNLPDSPYSSNPLRKIAGFVVTLAVIGLVLMFSMVAFVIIVVVGAIGWAYLWWKTRELRRQMREFRDSQVMTAEEMVVGAVTRGEVIEGEVIRVSETRDRQ